MPDPETKAETSVTATTTKAKYKVVPDDKSELPAPPWTYASLVERYGPEGGEEMYSRAAVAGGYFNPKSEPKEYRPDLAPPA